MASLAALLKQEIPEFFWVGFYLPREDGALIVGPYQGPLACILLPAGRGVCGASAKSRETILVPDVHAFPDHIACSGESRSEIVVPLLRGAELRAVLDVDSVRADEFGEEDQAVLERLAARLASLP
ncbi:MAG: GAF domain-containing protein [Planctomycetes bacterium]|nr:GAF domain-containing protein [Planctomycetota bacterium]